jgi:hypothetical protein
VSLKQRCSELGENYFSKNRDVFSRGINKTKRSFQYAFPFETPVFFPTNRDDSPENAAGWGSLSYQREDMFYESVAKPESEQPAPQGDV